MTTSITAVDVEQFRGTTFFRLTPHRPGNRVKIKDQSKHAAYLARLQMEIAAAKASKEGRSAVSLSQVAADQTQPSNGKTDTSKTSVSATKRLLVSPALDRLNQHLTETKNAICGTFGPAQQSKVLDGIYVVRNELIETIENQIAEAQARINDTWIDAKTGDVNPGFLPAFLEDLPQAIERARTLPLLEGGLGPLFDQDDYKTLADDWKEAFSLESQWLALGVPEDLPPALKAKAAEKFEKQLTEAAEECKDALRASLGSFLDRLVERLTPDESGKPKVFRDSLIENVRQFCEAFDARNFVKDDQLSALVTKCRKVLSNPQVTPDKVRKYSSVRENTAAQFAEIKRTLDGMIETRKARVFDLDSE